MSNSMSGKFLAAVISYFMSIVHDLKMVPKKFRQSSGHWSIHCVSRKDAGSVARAIVRQKMCDTVHLCRFCKQEPSLAKELVWNTDMPVGRYLGRSMAFKFSRLAMIMAYTRTKNYLTIARRYSLVCTDDWKISDGYGVHVIRCYIYTALEKEKGFHQLNGHGYVNQR